MSLLERKLLSLAGAALVLSAAFTYFNSNESKRKCFTHWEGDFSGTDASSIPLNFNVTGSRITSVDIPDGCPFWRSWESLLRLARITVCNEDGFILDVTLPKKGDLRRMDVRCYVKILGVSIPCILNEFNMEVHLVEYCKKIPKKERA